MEKYRQHADHGTGVSPFVPIRERREYSIASKLRGFAHLFILGPLLIVVRVPLLLVAALWLAVFGGAVPSIVACVSPGAAGLLRRLLQRPVARLALLLLGFWRTEQVNWPVLAPALAARRGPLPDPRPGDVVLANLASWVCPLVHCATAAPLFAFATDDAPGHEGKARFVTKGVLGAIAYAAKGYDRQRREAAAAGCDAATALRRASSGGSCLLLFFEGTATNGRGVLAPPPALLAALDAEQRRSAGFHVVAVRYERPSDVAGSEGSNRWSPCYPVGPWAPHFVGLVTRPAHCLLVSRPIADKTPTLPQLGGDVGLLVSQLVRRLCECTDGKLVQMTRERADKRAFLLHWGSTQEAASYQKD